MYRPFPGEDTELGPSLFDSKVQSVLLQPLQICQSGWGRGLDTPFALYRPQSQAASSIWASTSSFGKGLQIAYQDRRWAWGLGTAGCQLRLCHWPVVWPWASVFSSVKDTLWLPHVQTIHKITCGSSWHEIGVRADQFPLLFPPWAQEGLRVTHFIPQCLTQDRRLKS